MYTLTRVLEQNINTKINLLVKKKTEHKCPVFALQFIKSVLYFISFSITIKNKSSDKGNAAYC